MLRGYYHGAWCASGCIVCLQGVLSDMVWCVGRAWSGIWCVDTEGGEGGGTNKRKLLLSDCAFIVSVSRKYGRGGLTDSLTPLEREFVRNKISLFQLFYKQKARC